MTWRVRKDRQTDRQTDNTEKGKDRETVKGRQKQRARPKERQISCGKLVTYMKDGTSLKSVRQIRQSEYPENNVKLLILCSVLCKATVHTSCYWDLRLNLCYKNRERKGERKRHKEGRKIEERERERKER